jgi:energy-coupling factor transporter ATP-binding protein EcfA2
MRSREPWPRCALLGPFPELACTGLASGVAEELAVAASGGSTIGSVTDIKTKLGIEELLGKEIDTLSGGESVRLGLASVAAQGVEDLQIDTSLEQLDEQWRRLIFALLASQTSQIANRVFIADNHFSKEEISLFKDSLGG